MHNDKLVYKVVIWGFGGISLWKEKVVLTPRRERPTKIFPFLHLPNPKRAQLMADTYMRVYNTGVTSLGVQVHITVFLLEYLPLDTPIHLQWGR